jgi:hypothetical protein
VPKRNCIRRAEWKLQTGKPAEALSANYRLDCDYGTAVVTCWEKGGSEPVYVCESHAKQLGPSRDHGPEARILTAEAEQTEKPIKREERSRAPKIAVTKSSGAPLPQPGHDSKARILEAEAEQREKPIKRDERTPTREIALTKTNSAPLPEAAPNAAEPKSVRATTDVSARGRTRDLTFGNPAKAMVDEAIWNLAAGDYEVYRSALQQGKSAKEAAQAAGGQLAVIHQKISDYTLKLETVLSEAKATINVGETIDKPLEQATLEIISNEALSDPEKDAAIQQLGAIQEWVKQGLQEEMTALQTNQTILRIGERLNWGGTTEISEELKAVYRTLNSRLKTAICTAVPNAQTFLERLTNLYAAKSEMDRELLSTKELTQAFR